MPTMVSDNDDKEEADVCRVSVFHTSLNALRNPIKLNGSIQRSTFRRTASVVRESFTLNTFNYKVLKSILGRQ